MTKRSDREQTLVCCHYNLKDMFFFISTQAQSTSKRSLAE